ncbi:MAG: 3,5-epimerase/4-reductase [Oceanicoccus sp.]|jgi:3,5-epimerase/4-reductase
MKVLIFGKGYVAHHFLAHFEDSAVISDLRIQDYSAVKAEIEAQAPDVVINCVGKTGRPNVDWCEDNKMETLTSNVTAPLILAQACIDTDVYMVHVGSGCVYDGYNEGKGFAEDDEPNFDGSFYSRTKAWSEASLKELPVLQLRLRMPLDGMPGPRNFVTKITKYEKVINIQNSISVMEDFLNAADALIEKRATGIYNMTNPGTIDHATILDIYTELVDPSFKYEVFSVEEMHKITKARRSNCGLSAQKLEAEGVHMRPAEDAVRATLREYAENMAAGKSA